MVVFVSINIFPAVFVLKSYLRYNSESNIVIVRPFVVCRMFL